MIGSVTRLMLTHLRSVTFPGASDISLKLLLACSHPGPVMLPCNLDAAVFDQGGLIG